MPFCALLFCVRSVWELNTGRLNKASLAYDQAVGLK